MVRVLGPGSTLGCDFLSFEIETFSITGQKFSKCFRKAATVFKKDYCIGHCRRTPHSNGRFVDMSSYSLTNCLQGVKLDFNKAKAVPFTPTSFDSVDISMA